jgi:hypothetical protein
VSHSEISAVNNRAAAADSFMVLIVDDGHGR